MKRIFSLLLALLMLGVAILAVGCGEQPEPDQDSTGQPSTDHPTPDAPDTPDQGSESTPPDEPTKEELEAIKLQQDIEHYNYMIGTQAFNPGYQFTDLSPLMELAQEIESWGSNMIKFYATDDNMVDELLTKHDFDYVFMWYRSDPYFNIAFSLTLIIVS